MVYYSIKIIKIIKVSVLLLLIDFVMSFYSKIKKEL